MRADAFHNIRAGTYPSPGDERIEHPSANHTCDLVRFAGCHPLSSGLTTAHVESHPSGGVALTNRSGPMHTPVEAPAAPRHTTAPDPPRRCPKAWGGLGPAPRRVTRKHRGPHAHSYGSVCARVSWHRALAPPQGQSPTAWQDRRWPSPPPSGVQLPDGRRVPGVLTGASPGGRALCHFGLLSS